MAERCWALLGGAQCDLVGASACGSGSALSFPMSGSSLLAWTWLQRPWVWGGGGQTGGGAQMAIVIAGRERGDHRLLVGLAAQCTQQSVAVWPAGIY